MKINKHIHILQFWNPQTLKICRRFFLKSEIFIGSDPSADLRIEALEGLVARVDLESAELTYLASGQSEILTPHKLFEIGAFAFQWRKISLIQPKWLWSFSVFMVGLLMLGLGGWWAPHEGVRSPCSPFETNLSQGRWNSTSIESAHQKKILDELKGYKVSFLNALHHKNLTVARAELNSIGATLDKIPNDKGCSIRSELNRLEAKFSELRIQNALSTGQYIEAAEELARWSSKNESRKADRLLKRLRRKATDLYIEGYQLEESQPQKSEELMDQAEKICLALQLEADCYRSRRANVEKNHDSVEDAALDENKEP